MVLRKLAIAVALPLVAGAIAARGSAGPTTIEEVNSAVPPLTTDLEGHLERHFRDANIEVDLLVDGSDGSYEIFECRTRPNQPYSQSPKGACKTIH